MVPLKLSKCWAAFLDKADRDATAAIRKQAFVEAAAHCRETELLMPCPEPGSTMRVHGANVCMALAAEIEAMAEREGNDEQVYGN